MGRIRKASAMLCYEAFSHKGEEKRKLNSLFLLIYVEKIMKENVNALISYILSSMWDLRKLKKKKKKPNI